MRYRILKCYHSAAWFHRRHFTSTGKACVDGAKLLKEGKEGSGLAGWVAKNVGIKFGQHT